MKTSILDYQAIMEIARRDKERGERRYARHVARQNFAARNSYNFWIRVFNLFAL